MVTFPMITEEDRHLVSLAIAHAATEETNKEAERIGKLVFELFLKEEVSLIAACIALDAVLFTVQQDIHEQSLFHDKLKKETAGHG